MRPISGEKSVLAARINLKTTVSLQLGFLGHFRLLKLLRSMLAVHFSLRSFLKPPVSLPDARLLLRWPQQSINRT
jgi:hypothetical protein